MERLTHQRDIWLTDHECQLQILVNTSHKHSQAKYNIHTTLPDGIRQVMYTSRWAWKKGAILRYKAIPIKHTDLARLAQIKK